MLGQFNNIFKEALSSILRHKLRSFLTLLGVIFGVASVITMLGIGTGAQQSVLKQLSELGLNNIIINSSKPDHNDKQAKSSQRERVLSYGLTYKDQAQLENMLPHCQIIAGRWIESKLFFNNKRINTKILAMPHDFYELVYAKTIKGTHFSALTDQQPERIAIVNEAMAEKFNSVGGPLGATIKIHKTYYKVIGINSIPAHQREPYVYIPFSESKKSFGNISVKAEAGSFEMSKIEVGQLLIHVEDEDQVPATAAVVRRTLENNHQLEDYTITVPLDILHQKQETQRIFNLVLITIAAISLIVGGIGIMNIMLASVTERIPEIGIRRAVGATQKDILIQFLTETTTLSALGGIIGCLTGFIAVPLASKFTGWDGVITLGSVVISLLVAVTVGLVFGMAPAINAAKMDPGVALRYE